VKRTELKPRSVSLSRGAGPKRGRRRPRQKLDVEAAAVWGANNLGEPCAVCGGGCGPVQGHHALSQQWLRNVARTRGLDYEGLRWDLRNRLWVGRDCHSRHHLAVLRIPRSVLAPEVFEMAEELGLLVRLENTYPEGDHDGCA